MQTKRSLAETIAAIPKDIYRDPTRTVFWRLGRLGLNANLPVYQKHAEWGQVVSRYHAGCFAGLLAKEFIRLFP